MSAADPGAEDPGAEDPSQQPQRAQLGDEAEQASGPSRPDDSLRRELLLTFALSVVLTGALNQLQFAVPGVGPYLHLLVAAVFISLPVLVVRRRRGEEPETAGMILESSGRALRWGGALIALTIIPFAIGYHIWHAGVLGQRAAPAWDNYLRWNPEAEGFPIALRDDAAREDGADRDETVFLWGERARLRIWWTTSTSRAPVEVVITGPPGALDLEGTRGARAVEQPPGTWRVTATRPGNGGADLVRVAQSGGDLEVSASRGDAPIDPATMRLGASSLSPTDLPVTVSYELMWLLSLFLTQLLFVALPEEYFYRGYVLPTLQRLDGARGTRGPPRHAWRAIVLTSVLFALGHLLVDWHWTRGMVFFPSLVFCWLRLKSGGVLASTLYHACSNIMVELARVHYFPDA